MSDKILEFSIQGDREGYINFECPFCKSEFKLQAEEYQNEEIPVNKLYCPYCGLQDEKSNFYTKEVIEHAKTLAMNYMYDEINKAFKGMANKINKSKVLKMEFKPLKKVNVKELKEEDTTEEIFKCKFCNHHVKVLYCVGVSKIFCSFCGVDI